MIYLFNFLETLQDIPTGRTVNQITGNMLQDRVDSISLDKLVPQNAKVADSS